MMYPSHLGHELYEHVLSALPDAPVVPDRPGRATRLWRTVIDVLRGGTYWFERPVGGSIRPRPSLQ